MNPELFHRLFDPRGAFDSPVVVALTIATVALLLIAPIVIRALAHAGRIDAAHRAQLMCRFRSWLFIVPMMAIPVLLGVAYTIVAVLVLCLLCYREFARATGLFREKPITAVVAGGIVLSSIAALKDSYELYAALWLLVSAGIAALALISDRPKGYIQRVAMGIFAYTLFGALLGHLSFFANLPNYRAILFWLVLCVEMNDIFAYIAGKTFGERRLAPRTSPNKTIAGAIGAVVLTTALAATAGHFAFRHTALDRPQHLIALGVGISVLGQAGDLVISSIKRDLDVKDMGCTFPGHGGVLDRFDSLILVAPFAVQYVTYFNGG